MRTRGKGGATDGGGAVAVVCSGAGVGASSGGSEAAGLDTTVDFRRRVAGFLVFLVDFDDGRESGMLLVYNTVLTFREIYLRLHLM